MLSALFDPVSGSSVLWSRYWKSSLTINKISENSFPVIKKDSILTIRKHVFDWTDINYMFIKFIKSYYGLLFYFSASPANFRRRLPMILFFFFFHNNFNSTWLEHLMACSTLHSLMLAIRLTRTQQSPIRAVNKWSWNCLCGKWEAACTIK